jgi:ketosteroid isomerase-like protein
MALCFGGAQAQTADQQITEIMHQQELAWNKGDIRGFMEAYWHSDSLQFIGSKGVTRGWDNTLANYLKSYDTPAKMGQLHFTILEQKMLSPDYVYLTGKWQLEREKPVGGHFTLVWKRIQGKWLIISDHTS